MRRRRPGWAQKQVTISHTLTPAEIQADLDKVANYAEGGDMRRGGPHADGEDDVDSAEGYFEVEKLLEMRVKRRVRQFKVRWKGCSTDEDQWVNEEDLGEEPMCYDMDSSLRAQLEQGSAPKTQPSIQKAATGGPGPSLQGQAANGETGPHAAVKDDRLAFATPADAPQPETMGRRTESTDFFSTVSASRQMTVGDVHAAEQDADVVADGRSNGVAVGSLASPSDQEDDKPEECESDPGEEGTVEMLLARKELHNGVVKFLVRWAGEGSDQDSWIPEENFNQPMHKYKMTAEVAHEIGNPHVGSCQGRSLLRETNEVEREEREFWEQTSDEGASDGQGLDEHDDVENINMEHRSTSQGADVVDVDAEGNGEELNGGYYPVAGIVDVRVSRTSRGRKSSYKVRWKGYGPEADTWVLEDDLGASLDHYHVDPKVRDKLDELAMGAPQHTPQKRNTPVTKRKRRVSKRQGGAAQPAGKAKKAKAVPVLKVPPSNQNGKGEFWAVERLLRMRDDSEGGREFKVRWKNYSWRFDTWVKEEDLREAVHKFEMSPALRCHLGARPKRGKHT